MQRSRSLSSVIVLCEVLESEKMGKNERHNNVNTEDLLRCISVYYVLNVRHQRKRALQWMLQPLNVQCTM